MWGVNLGVIDWNPWQVRAPELDRPDELRVDLDPTPEASWDDVRQVALVCGEVLSDYGLTGYPKTREKLRRSAASTSAIVAAHPRSARLVTPRCRSAMPHGTMSS